MLQSDMTDVKILYLKFNIVICIQQLFSEYQSILFHKCFSK